MHMLRSIPKICNSCSYQLFNLYVNGLIATPGLIKHGGRQWVRDNFRRGLRGHPRSLTSSRAFRASVEDDERQGGNGAKSPAQMEAIVRQARQTFGETLPADFLSREEYQIYVRLYGPPSATTLPEDVDLLRESDAEDEDPGKLPFVLMRENEDGKWEEVVDEEEDMEEELEPGSQEATGETEEPEISAEEKTGQEFNARMTVLRDTAAMKAADAAAEKNHLGTENERKDIEEEVSTLQEESQEEGLEDLEDNYRDDIDEQGNAYDESDGFKTHPLTLAGRSGTHPTTIQLPKDTFVDPISALLADVSNKQLAEVTLKTFGGQGLPNSTATKIRPDIIHKPIGLDAYQWKMGEMEGNAYMAAIMPGAYATVMATLVEVRKRLGSEWLRKILRRPDGPRILDAGAAGAGVLAWRDVLRAEWELMHPDGAPHIKRPPYGKSTVVTGSSVLRHRASQLLDDTAFIPRLPDYDPSRDHPSLENDNPQPRKQYDIIIAPHTLWPLREDYMRKAQVENFWSLLDPKGGVLILIEKGVPRGFEVIAGARETLLKHHISSPGSETVENPLPSAAPNRFGPKEKGMIIAPCTNHAACPMYIHAGHAAGRKDFCHFSQRYLRPPFLQRIHGARDRNHEDIQYSYVALQRGVDQRELHDFEQGHAAADAAYAGFEETDADPEIPNINPLSLPRAILPAIKRTLHVTLDLCTPAGKIERWTVPKSFSLQAYHDARKSRWGDLWALGAKTRVERNIRVGKKGGDEKGRDEDVGGEKGGEGRVKRTGKRGKGEKRERKGKADKYKMKSPRSEEEDMYFRASEL